MSGTPADIMRATNSSGSMLREALLMVSTKEAAEYCRTPDGPCCGVAGCKLAQPCKGRSRALQGSAQTDVPIQTAAEHKSDRVPAAQHSAEQVTKQYR